MSILFLGDTFSNYHKSLCISDDIKRIIGKNKYIVCNFEGALADSILPYHSKVGPAIRQDLDFTKSLIENGINIFTLANNHIFDFDYEGARSTLDFFESRDILHGGLLDRNKDGIVRIKENNKNISIICASEKNGISSSKKNGSELSYHLIFDHKFEQVIKNEKKICDYVVLFLHGGLEGYELPLKNFSKRYKQFIDLGADIIIAHHPHIIQPSEVYKNKKIYYSLGDFYFSHESIKRMNKFGLGVQINFFDEIETEDIFFKFENNILDLTEGELIQKDLRNKINSYDSNENHINEVYEKFVMPLVLDGFGGLSNKQTLLQNIKNIARSIYKKSHFRKKRILLLKHLLKNDAYKEMLFNVDKYNKILNLYEKLK